MSTTEERFSENLESLDNAIKAQLELIQDSQRPGDSRRLSSDGVDRLRELIRGLEILTLARAHLVK